MKLPHKHYPDYANPELLDKIPLNAKTILDVGCAQGALGAAYLRRNPNCRVLGIDLDDEAIDQARHRLTEVVCGDVEQTPMPFEVPGGIDCIVYGDVLEHLIDPWALLAEHAKYLAPHGTVLVCMPNVEHWSFAARLLTGTFDYEEIGLFDRTHLRWFTPRTMGAALTAAGLMLADIAPRPISTEKAEQFTQALAPGLAAIGVDPNEYFNRAGPVQFIWRARKAAPGNIEVSATMLAPQGGVSDVRVVEPIRALTTESRMVAKVVPEEAIAPIAAELPRIAVLHRPLMSGRRAGSVSAGCWKRAISSLPNSTTIRFSWKNAGWMWIRCTHSAVSTPCRPARCRWPRHSSYATRKWRCFRTGCSNCRPRIISPTPST